MIIRIAIDPDIEKPGVATMTDGKITSLQSMSFLDLLAGIQDNFGYKMEQTMGGDLTNPVGYYVEDVELIKPTWSRSNTNNNTMLKIAQNVGMVKAVGRLIGKQFARCEIEYELVAPIKGYLKRGKKDAEFFNKLMGWSGKSNVDNRDAALLLFPYLTSVQKTCNIN